jgi:C_GCAxxG_C_C family probable redox protein
MDVDAKTAAALQEVYEIAYEYEQKHGCCGQCVLAAVQDVIGVGDDLLFKASHTLSAGGALTTGGTCGALAGALLAVGSVYGRAREEFADGRNTESFEKAKQIYDAFVAEFDSPICADIQTKIMGRSFEMWDREGFAAFLEAGGHDDKCPHVVGRAAQMATELLLKE